MRPARQSFLAVTGLAASLTLAGSVHALDLPKVGGKPLRLDVTETTIGLQRFDAREGLSPRENGWGSWLNKLNVQLNWGRWTVGTRVDSSLYWRRPIDRSFCAEGCTFTPGDRPAMEVADSSRYRDAVYLAKAWATYKAPGVEATVGDAYAQFGRGLVLSLRKVDELGIDTTARGAKLSIQKDPVSLQVVAGYANPARVDEATGAALFLPRELADQTRGPQPVFGSDRVIGAEIAAGRGTPIITGTRVARFFRCAPYSYDERGRVQTNFTSSAFGSCGSGHTEQWISSLSNALNPLMTAREVTLLGQSFEVPNLWGHGSLYLEGAVQDRVDDSVQDPDRRSGNALYGSFVTNFGPVTNTLEVKSYRNFYAVPAAIDATRALPFTTVQYTNLPTAEPIIQDSMFGFFNACVNGGRLRTDVRITPTFLVYGVAGYSHSKSEAPGAGCDRFGRSTSSEAAGNLDTYVWDGLSGVEWRFDRDRSQVLFSLGTRNDRFASGLPFYTERSANYTVSIYVSGPYSFELYGRHRIRSLFNENIHDELGGRALPWGQGFHTTALKIAPKWVLGQGIEYYGLTGQPTYYVNGQILYRFTSESNLKLLVGQQQGGLRCVSGVCRVFPAFEGVRAELTLRF